MRETGGGPAGRRAGGVVGPVDWLPSCGTGPGWSDVAAGPTITAGRGRIGGTAGWIARPGPGGAGRPGAGDGVTGEARADFLGDGACSRRTWRRWVGAGRAGRRRGGGGFRRGTAVSGPYDRRSASPRCGRGPGSRWWRCRGPPVAYFAGNGAPKCHPGEPGILGVRHRRLGHQRDRGPVSGHGARGVLRGRHPAPAVGSAPGEVLADVVRGGGRRPPPLPRGRGVRVLPPAVGAAFGPPPQAEARENIVSDGRARRVRPTSVGRLGGAPAEGGGGRGEGGGGVRAVAGQNDRRLGAPQEVGRGSRGPVRRLPRSVR